MDNIRTWTGLPVEESVRMTEINGESTSMLWPALADRGRLENRTEQIVCTVGPGERLGVGLRLFDGELGDVLGHVDDLSARAQLGALDEAAEPAPELGGVGGVELARADLGRQRGDVVAVLVPPDLAALVPALIAPTRRPHPGGPTRARRA